MVHVCHITNLKMELNGDQLIMLEISVKYYYDENFYDENIPEWWWGRVRMTRTTKGPIFEWLTHSTQRYARKLTDGGYLTSLDRIGPPAYRLTEKGIQEGLIEML